MKYDKIMKELNAQAMARHIYGLCTERIGNIIQALSSREQKVKELGAVWHQKAFNLREEANRIRRTVKQPTGAEERANVRAEIYDECGKALSALSEGAGGETEDGACDLINTITHEITEKLATFFIAGRHVHDGRIDYMKENISEILRKHLAATSPAPSSQVEREETKYHPDTDVDAWTHSHPQRSERVPPSPLAERVITATIVDHVRPRPNPILPDDGNVSSPPAGDHTFITHVRCPNCGSSVENRSMNTLDINVDCPHCGRHIEAKSIFTEQVAHASELPEGFGGVFSGGMSQFKADEKSYNEACADADRHIYERVKPMLDVLKSENERLRGLLGSASSWLIRCNVTGAEAGQVKFLQNTIAAELAKGDGNG